VGQLGKLRGGCQPPQMGRLAIGRRSQPPHKRVIRCAPQNGWYPHGDAAQVLRAGSVTMKGMWLEAVGGLAAAAGGMAYAVRSPRSSLLAPSVYRGGTSRKSIAITFDDGPSESTPELLELLARYGARATFFQLGANARRLPEVSRAVSAAGHEIGNHTYSHPLLPLKSPAFLYSEIRDAQSAIEDAAGTTPALFRAPFGVRWFGLRGAQRHFRLNGVMWTVIGLDWKLTAEAVTARLLDAARPGAIVCLHDGRTTQHNPNTSVTRDTIRSILPIWAEQGYQFETVSQILCKTN
jgi:peptidoglycan/xylan/chitin deacetylase (PgdA/CDA1 family)